MVYNFHKLYFCNQTSSQLSSLKTSLHGGHFHKNHVYSELSEKLFSLLLEYAERIYVKKKSNLNYLFEYETSGHYLKNNNMIESFDDGKF